MLKPFFLFDEIKREFNLPNDRALSDAMGVAPPQVSKVRNGSYALSDSMILRVHERFNIPVANVRAMLAESPQ